MGLFDLIKPRGFKPKDSPKEDTIEVEGKVVVMADFSSSGLWLPSNEYIAGGGMIDYEQTKLPEDIIKELDDWIYSYEELWYNSYSKIVEKRVPKFNAWGKMIAVKIKEFYKSRAEVWYCYQDEDYNSYCKDDKINKFCVVTRKSDDVTLGCSLIKTIEVIGVEQNHYYPVVGAKPGVGTQFIPKESKDFPGCLEWDYTEFAKQFPELCD